MIKIMCRFVMIIHIRDLQDKEVFVLLTDNNVSGQLILFIC